MLPARLTPIRAYSPMTAALATVSYRVSKNTILDNPKGSVIVDVSKSTLVKKQIQTI